jgi:hypothetical protein
MNASLRRLIFAPLLAATTAACVVVTLPPPPQTQTEARSLDTEVSEPATAEVQAGTAPVDGPSLDSLRGSRNDWVAYRILTREDFQAKSSYSLWGNVAHAAEICSFLFSARRDEDAAELHAVMHPRCSFWNRTTKVVNRMGRLAGAIAGVPVIVPGELPPWYVLQHEQLHFAITEVAARRYARALAKLGPKGRDAVGDRLYTATLERMQERNAQLDGDTSGTFAPRALEKWVRVLESELKELCGKGPKCRVRTEDPRAN